MKNKNKILDIVGGILGGILVLGLCILPFWSLKQEIDLINKCKYTIIDANGTKYHAKSFTMVRGVKIIKLVDYQDRKITIYGVKTIIEK